MRFGDKKRRLVASGLILLAIAIWVTGLLIVRGALDGRIGHTPSGEASLPADDRAMTEVKERVHKMLQHGKAMAEVNGPYMSNPRRIVIGETARQSTAAVVQDLGDPWAGHFLIANSIMFVNDSALSYCA